MNRPFRHSAIARFGAIACCLLMMSPSLVWAGDEPWSIPTRISHMMTEDSAAEVADAARELDLEVTEDGVELTLDQLVTMALRRNLALVVERYRRNQTDLRIQEALGIYDFNIDVQSAIGEDSNPISSTLQIATGSIDFEFQQVDTTLSQLFSTGGTGEVLFRNQRATSSNLANVPNPSFTLGLDFRFTQPLLRNRGREATERNILVARNNLGINREDFQTRVEDVLKQVSDAYWSLVEAREQLAVAEESLQLADELHEMNRIQVEVGTLAPLEMVQSEAGVAARRQDIIRFSAQVQDQEDILRRLVNLDRGALWDVEIVPTTEPETVHSAIDLNQAFKAAVEKRPDIRSLRLNLETRALDARVAANQLKPRLDAQAIWGVNAVDGTQRTGPPNFLPTEVNGYLDAFDQLVSSQFDGWQIGVQFVYPMQNRTAKARKTIADLDVERGEIELRDLEEQILVDVRRTARGVETAAQQIESAKVSSKLARKNLEAEQKRYENGLSTSFQVLQIQEDLSEARRQEVSAIISYRRAETDYLRAVGELLETNGVRLADDEN